jgi:hypothetical protein
MQSSNLHIAEKWFEAFNVQDLEALLALYDDNAQHYSPKLLITKPETKGLIQGKSQLRAWWQDAFERMPELHYEVINLLANDTDVFMEYLRQNPGDTGLRVGETLKIEKGLIVASRVFHS